MADLTADFEGGVDGATITTGTGEASASAWAGVSGTPVYDDTQVSAGSLAALFDASADYLEWALPSPTDHYGRFYIFFPGDHATTYQRLLYIRQGGTMVAELLLESGSRRFIIADGPETGQQTSTNQIAQNQWVRVEYHIVHSATVGQIEVKFFNDPESSVPTETMTSPATWDTGTAGTTFQIGELTGADTFWLDDIVANATSYPGPATYTSWFGTRDTSGTDFEPPSKNYDVVSGLFSLPETGLVNKLNIYCQAGSTMQIKGAIYADSSGEPGALMGVTDEATVPVLGSMSWVDMPFSTPVSLPPGDYWLGFNHNGDDFTHRFHNAGAGRRFRSNAYPDFWDPFGPGAAGDSKQTTIYATYAADGLAMANWVYTL